jgi:peptidase inhibitor family I36
MTALTASGLGLALAVPASAAAPVPAASVAGRAIAIPAPGDPLQCPSNSMCWWEHSNFDGVGAYEVLDQRYASGTCLVWSARWQGQISSLVNTSDRNLVVFQGNNCEGASFVLPPGSQSPDLGSFNDAVTSFRV